MRIAVTGGSGLVGRAIVRRLAKRHDVVNVDLATPDPAGLEYPAVEHAHIDILDVERLAHAFHGTGAVVHAAAIPGPEFGSEEDITEVNVEGTRNVAVAADRAGVGRVVFISSESVPGLRVLERCGGSSVPAGRRGPSPGAGRPLRPKQARRGDVARETRRRDHHGREHSTTLGLGAGGVREVAAADG